MKYEIDGIQVRIVEQPHEGLTYVERTQPNEAAILALNEQMRKERILRDLEFGRCVAQIPVIAYETVIPRDYPDYLTGDGNTRKATLMRMLIDHPEWMVLPKEDVFARRH